MNYQERFAGRYYVLGRLTATLHSHLPERVRMWSPWWLRHVVAVERTMHGRTMHDLRDAEARPLKPDAIERAAEALCAWPMVKVDDREHGTATHMATDALAAAMSRNEPPTQGTA